MLERKIRVPRCGWLELHYLLEFKTWSEKMNACPQRTSLSELDMIPLSSIFCPACLYQAAITRRFDLRVDFRVSQKNEDSMTGV